MSIAIPTPRIHPSAFVAPGARIHGDVTIGAGAVVMFGVVARAELDRIRVGEATNLQDNAVLHCDEGVPCLVGTRVTVGHSAVLHGATIGDHCLIGIAAAVLNRAVVGEGAWVAAGSVVTEGSQIPPWTLAVGTPAKPRRELTEDEVRRQQEGVEHYLELAVAYRQLLGG